MILRPAVPRDAAAVAALDRDLLGADAWSESAVLDELSGPGRRAVVADEGGVVLGYAVTRVSGDLADLQRIGVRTDAQRRGVASRLLGEVVAGVRTDGAAVMLLEVSAANATALSFYAHHGFVEIDRRRRYYRDGSDAVVMRRRWEPATADGRG